MNRYSWMDAALCAQADPNTWTDTPPGAGSAVPKRICHACPVTTQCAAHEQALRAHDGGPLHGIWAGQSRRQRKNTHRSSEATA